MDTSKPYQRGFLLPLNLSPSNIDSSTSTFSTDDIIAGQSVSSSDEKLTITTRGKQISPIEIQTKEAGTPGRGNAAFLFKRNTDNDFYGSNSVNEIADFQILKKQTGSNEYESPYSIQLKNGDLLVCYFQSIGGTKSIVVDRLPADRNVWSSTTVFSALTVTSPNPSFPCLLQLPDESIICVFFVDFVLSSSGESNLYVYSSSDNGQSFSLSSQNALDVGIDNTNYDIQKSMIEYYNGQILFIASMVKPGATYPDIILQAASLDEGMNFSTVGVNDDNHSIARPSLCVNSKGFLITYISTENNFSSSDGYAFQFQFPNAFFPFSSRGTLEKKIRSERCGTFATTAPHICTEGNHGGWTDEDNNIFLIFQNLSSQNHTNGGNGGLWMILSNDDGKNYSPVGEPKIVSTNFLTASIKNYIYTQNSDTSKLQNIIGVSARGSSFLFCQPDNSASIDKSILSLGLRAYSDITRPGKQEHDTIFQGFGWNHTYLPIIIPSTLPNWVSLSSGSPVVSLTSDGLAISTTSADNQSYKYNYISPNPNSTDNGTICRFSVVAAVGGSTSADERSLICYIGDGVNSYKIGFRISTTQIVLRDEITSSTIGTVTPNPSTILTDTGVEILFSLAKGKITAWYRSNDHLDMKGWNNIVSGQAVSNGGISSVNYIQFGHIVTPPSPVSSFWGEVLICYEKAGSGIFNTDIANGYATPTDTRGRLYPSYGNDQILTEGLFIGTQDGPASKQDSFTISPSSQFSINNIFHSISPSPSIGWRSAKTTSASGLIPSELISLNLSHIPDQDIHFFNDVLGIHLNNINFYDFTIEGWNPGGGGTWSVIATINTSQNIQMNRNGDRMEPVPTSPPNNYFSNNELAGWFVEIPPKTPGNPTITREVLTNSEGLMINALQPKKCILQLKDVESIDNTSGNCKLFPNIVSIVINLNGAKYSKIGIRINQQFTAHQQFRIGNCSIGPVHVLAPQYANGRDISYTSNIESFIQPDGIVRNRKRGKGKRTYTISWTNPIDTSSFYPFDGSPSNINYYKLSNNASARAIANYGSVPFDISGYLQQMENSLSPIVYLPSLKYSTSAPEDVRTLKRKEEGILCYFDDTATITNQIGDEFQSITGETFRINSISLTEVI